MLQGVGLEQAPQLTLTPEVRQGIEVMAMSAIELSEYLERRLGDNPFLLREEEAGGSPAPTDGLAGWDDLPDRAGRARSAGHGDGADRFDPDGLPVAEADDPWRKDARALDERLYDHGASWGQLGSGEAIEGSAGREEGLEAQVYRQLAMELRDPEDLVIAEHLVGALDEAGYLRVGVDAVARRVPTTAGRVLRVLRAMQVGCDPAGLGARDLRERLVAQLAARGCRDPLPYRLVRSHLEDLAEGRLSRAAAALGVPLPQVRQAYELIRRLDPHPAARFGERSHYVRPEVAIVEGPAGYEVRFDDRLLPRVLLNRDYAAMMEGQSLSRQASRELVALLREAESLMGAVERRRATVLAMATVIAEQEEAFFREGPSRLRPFTMAEMASEVGVSESTVSRVANGLFMETPRGVLEMRFFFHSSVGAPGAEAVSSLAVKQLIRQLVDEEDPQHPLSDGQLVEALAAQGVEVSRRTVNKYRTALGILSQAKRRCCERD